MSRSLAFEDVRKSFGRGRRARPVLTGLSWSLPAGATGVLLGESGSGKSTLLRIAAGLETADAGVVRLGDLVLSGARPRVPAERRRVGFVFQDLELWPHLSVAQNVAFGLPERPSARQARRHPRVTALAERLGFAALLDRRPPLLSGGERQRVALARALAPEPDVVLLDEPLTNLDPRRREDLIGLLRAVVRERGVTALHVTHDPHEALALADEVAVLAGGRIVELGPPAALYAAPRTEAAARALGPVNLLPARRDGDAWSTALGRLPARAADDPQATHVLLRPEDLEVSPQGVAAVVRQAWPRGASWLVQVSVGDLALEARAHQPPPGQGGAVHLSVRRPVGGITPTPVGAGTTEAR